MLSRRSWDRPALAREQERLRLYVTVYRWGVLKYFFGILLFVIVLAVVIAGSLEPLSRDLFKSSFLLAVTATASLLLWSYAFKRISRLDVTSLANIKQHEAQIRTLISERRSANFGDKTAADLQIHKLLLQIANSASAVLSREVGANCAIAIKLLLWDPENRTALVHSLVRDKESKPLRGSSPSDFPVQSNTAFNEILFNPDCKRYYVSDDLVGLFVKGKYENKNEEWPELYNSTAVCGIKNDDSVVGFFCADSLEGKLSGPRVKDLLDLLSSHAYACLQLLYRSDYPQIEHAPYTEPKIGLRVEDGIAAPADFNSQMNLQSSVSRLESAIQFSSDGDNRGDRIRTIRKEDEGVDSSKVDQLDLQHLIAFAQERLKVSKDVGDLLERHQKSYDSAWQEYKKSVQK